MSWGWGDYQDRESVTEEDLRHVSRMILVTGSDSIVLPVQRARHDENSSISLRNTYSACRASTCTDSVSFVAAS